MTKLLKPILFALLLVTGQLAQAQANQTEGVVVYTRRTFWPKITARMTYLSQEQKDRAANTWKNEEGSKEKMKLSFTPNTSLYGYASESGESEDGRYTWRNRELAFFRDFANEKQVDIEEMLGKVYVIEDSLRIPSWKIGNQVREIAGHMCINATTTDPVKDQVLTAWFAQDIPVSAGPERICGLPGLILELDINNGDVIIETASITFKPVAADIKLPKIKKPKKLDEKGYESMLKTYIAEQIKEQQNPYWEIRY
ncbi:GLPGLI family protein [Fibrivirga algicola]|uniref:GLPGLI family protein n=1 Tax=Fibrivirga algicola TaxID=2950420 RepID=A0ABX0QJD0_9BACT|nr:GLPGLI family protein [Fibrivirga algicola]NID10963.1 GLPGLI family protein [Fibrivirga algicola]